MEPIRPKNPPREVRNAQPNTSEPKVVNMLTAPERHSVILQPAQRIRSASLTCAATSTVLAVAAFALPGSPTTALTIMAIVCWVGLWLVSDLFPAGELSLRADVFEVVEARLVTQHRWRDVDNFRVVEDTVVFDHAHSNYDVRLPGLYGLTPETLAELLQRRRDAA